MFKESIPYRTLVIQNITRQNVSELVIAFILVQNSLNLRGLRRVLSRNRTEIARAGASLNAGVLLLLSLDMEEKELEGRVDYCADSSRRMNNSAEEA